MKCLQCGKEITGEGIAFCPYCGAKIGTEAAGIPEQETDPRVAEWITKAMRMTSLPERKKVLDQAKAEFPDAREIDWELLFIGRPNPKPPRGRIDFSIIKSHLLQMYRTPGDFSAEQRDRMRTELTEDPEMERVAGMFPDPEGKKREYLLRICLEYIEIFLEEDSRVMGSLFGFKLVRNKGKAVAVPVSEMIRRMDADEKLTPEQHEMLRQTMIQAFSERMGGTEYLTV